MCAKRKTAKEKKNLFSASFYSDLEADGMLLAKLIRSPYAQGTIDDILLPPLDDGYYFFSSKDIIGKKSIKTLGVETPIFCNGTISYKGEPLGILVGSDEQMLESLSEAVTVILKPLPADEGEEEASPTEAQALLPQAERIVRYGESDDEAFEKLFEEAAYSIDGFWNSMLHPISYGEPSGALAFVKSGTLHVSTATQWLSHLRKALCDVTGMESEKIVITKTQVSDLNANVLWHNTVLAAQVATAAILTGKPVMLMLSREEQDAYLDKTAPVSIIYKTALSKTGEFTAIDCTIDIDTGYANPLAKEFLNRIVLASISIYRTKHLRITATARQSHNQPYAINLSTIDSQAFFAIENQMQQICARTTFTPLELRLKNWKMPNVRRDSYPFLIPCEKVKETLEAVCRASDFLRKFVSYKLDEPDRYKKSFNSPFSPPLRGCSLACAFQGSGFLGTTFSTKNSSLDATLNKDGTLSIHTLPPSPTIWKAWQKIAANILELEESKVTLNDSFLIGTEPEEPEILNSNIGIKTSLLEKCCKALKSKKSGELPVTVKKRLTPTIRNGWDKETFSGIPFFSTAFAAAVVDLELDANTYREHIKGIWVVVNGGKILNAKAAEGTIKIAIQRVLESLIEDDSLTFSNIRVQFVQSNNTPSPLGDLMYAVIPPAFAAALSQALQASITSLPIKTDTMYLISAQTHRALQEIIAEQKATLEKRIAEESQEALSEETAAKATEDAESAENADAPDILPEPAAATTAPESTEDADADTNSTGPVPSAEHTESDTGAQK